MEPRLFSVPIAGKGAVATSYWPASEPKAMVLIHPATGVTQGYYDSFARFLHGLGFSVATYDYRGTGRSRPASLRGLRVSMSDWIDDDVGAMTRWAATELPDAPLLAVGHSVGGHAIGLCADSRHLRAAVLVASHAGATRTIRGWAERSRVRMVLRVLAPLLCSIMGYMPGRRLGLGEDLPSDVMMQWSRWTSLPRYFFDDPALDAARRMARVRIPLLVLGFDDDPWANPAAIDLFTAGLTQASIERRQYNARAAGVPALGHMGFFRKRCETVLWREVGMWLLSHSAADRRSTLPAGATSEAHCHASI
ncbi:MAG: alpha/beta fold hydrolase [Pseudomonadota bacterium]|nr:alpha/beta fold hydrolase [Pseudomonadota bacterium]